jgi:hypothetical protein
VPAHQLHLLRRLPGHPGAVPQAGHLDHQVHVRGQHGWVPGKWGRRGGGGLHRPPAGGGGEGGGGAGGCWPVQGAAWGSPGPP